MVALRHGPVSVDVEFASAGRRCLVEHFQIVRSIHIRGKSEPHGRPTYANQLRRYANVLNGGKVRTIFMLDLLEALTENIVHVDQLRMAGICHSVIADENDIDDVRQVARLDLELKIPRKCVHINKRFLNMQ